MQGEMEEGKKEFLKEESSGFRKLRGRRFLGFLVGLDNCGSC